MTKRATRKAAEENAAEETEAAVGETAARTVRYVVNRPYSAGETLDIVDAEVTHEYEGEQDLLRLRLVDPPRGVEEDLKRVPRSDRHAPGTWFEVPAAEEEVTNGDEG